MARTCPPDLTSACFCQIDPAKPYSGQAAVRGAYINSGSRDIGPDPVKYNQDKGELASTPFPHKLVWDGSLELRFKFVILLLACLQSHIGCIQASVVLIAVYYCRMKHMTSTCQHSCSQHAAHAAFQSGIPSSPQLKRRAWQASTVQCRQTSAKSCHCQAMHDDDVSQRSNARAACHWWHQVHVLACCQRGYEVCIGHRQFSHAASSGALGD